MVKLLYNQPYNQFYPFKVIRLAVSLIAITPSKGGEQDWLGPLVFCQCIHICIISLQPFICVFVCVCVCDSLSHGPQCLEPWVCVSLGPETWNLHYLINIQAFTGGCNSQLGPPLVLEPQRQTILAGIGPPFLFICCQLHEKRNHWTQLGDIWMTLPAVVAMKANSKTNKNEKKKN